MPFEYPRRVRQEHVEPRPPRSGPVPFEVAVEVLLRRSSWAVRTQTKAREILLGGPFTAFRAANAIRSIGDLTDEHGAEFLRSMREAGLRPGTIVKTRQTLIALQRFAASTPGYSTGMTRPESLPKPRVPERILPVLSPADEVRVLHAAKHERDRLIIETMLASGIRVGELVALQLDDLHLDGRRPYVHIRRSVGEEMTKSGRDRVTPLDWAGGTLSRRLRTYVERGRPQSHRLEVFLRLRPDGRGDHLPILADGVGRILEDIQAATGIRVHPHLLRHTWATRAANAGVPIPLLQEAGGWRSLAMLRRYVASDRDAMLDAFARAHRGG